MLRFARWIPNAPNYVISCISDIHVQDDETLLMFTSHFHLLNTRGCRTYVILSTPAVLQMDETVAGTDGSILTRCRHWIRLFWKVTKWRRHRPCNSWESAKSAPAVLEGDIKAPALTIELLIGTGIGDFEKCWNWHRLRWWNSYGDRHGTGGVKMWRKWRQHLRGKSLQAV